MLTGRSVLLAPMSNEGQPMQGGAVTGSHPVLDAGALANLRELDPTGKNRLLERVFAAFQTSTARLVPQLLESQERADLAGVRHVAHTLKSSAASVGGMRLSGICAEIESRIRQGDTGDLRPQVDALVTEVRALLDALEQLNGARS